MITHRLSTKTTPAPPVKFYRTVALSFLVITIILLGVVIFITSKKASITIVAKEDAKPLTLTVSVGPTQAGANSVTGVVTSTVFKWSEKYSPSGNKVVTNTATGEALIYNKSNLDQTLVKTTRLLTPSGLLFRLSEKVIVPANGKITVGIYADQPGAAGEIGPSQFTVPGLSAEKQKVVYGESTKPTVGGTRKIGILSEEDIKAAKVDYTEKVKQAWATEANKIMGSGQKITAIADQNVTVNKQAGDEVTEFTLNGNNTIVAVAYNQEELTALFNKELTDKIDPSAEKVLSAKKEPTVSLVSYDLNRGTAQLSAIEEITVTLDANAEKLAVTNFLGKSKDEIERYVLGLNHVTGVEVKFSPAWMLSAPTVPDRIKIIVKNIQ
ncbi:MAG: hypothetical protein AAB678_03135 [Patescibacteria group bacterium]